MYSIDKIIRDQVVNIVFLDATFKFSMILFYSRLIIIWTFDFNNFKKLLEHNIKRFILAQQLKFH